MPFLENWGRRTHLFYDHFGSRSGNRFAYRKDNYQEKQGPKLSKH
jgi:hypothetical protein